ncbi:MAG TPA: KH domain-containing protein [Terracidiphilus sp.]|nr:KH domain-containing protein [Terracidiphilus sp.]
MLIPFRAQTKVAIFANAPVRGKNMTQHDMVAVDDLVREIARALVDDPASVEVQAVERDENTVLKLRVAPQDVGKVIGKQGRTARSVRTILGAVSMKLHHRYTLDILEEDEEG